MLAALIPNAALVMETNVLSLMKIASVVWNLWPCLCFSKSLKRGNLIKVHYRVMSFGQNVALEMVNKFVKLDDYSLHFVKVMTEICCK